MSLLARLEKYKGQFGAGAAGRVAALLEQAQQARFRDPEELIRLHETVLYLRAYPQSPRVLQLADEILHAFGDRLKGIERQTFEYADVSGIARTGLTTNFSYPFAKSLAERHANGIGIDWDKYEHPGTLGPLLARRL